MSAGISTRRAHLTWATLMVATVGSVGTAEYLGHPLLAVAAIMGIAALKIHLILRHFMELKDGPVALRVLFGLWTAGCMAMIVGFYWAALPG